MRIDIYGDNIGYVTDEVSTIPIDEANLNEDNRRKFVTDLAAISRGKHEAKNPSKRYDALLSEAAPQKSQIEVFEYNRKYIDDEVKINGSPSRPLEFLPIVTTVEMDGMHIKAFGIYYGLAEFTNAFGGSFGYLSNQGIKELNYPVLYLYTNMRAVINAGVPYENIPYNTKEELKNFRAIKANIPMFVWAQVPNTHIMLSKEAQSDRVTINDNYWLPKDFIKKVYAFSYYENNGKGIFSKITDEVLGCSDRNQIPHLLINGRNETNFKPTQNDIQQYFRILGYHKEIYQRAMYYLKYKEVVVTGWCNNPKTWSHLFIERNAETDIWKNWTQGETSIFVNAVKKIVEK